MKIPARLRCLSFSALLALSAAGLAHAGEPEQYGQWKARCEPTQGKVQGGCFIYQNLVLREGGQRVLQFAVGFVDGTDEPIALISLPLGISLPPGVALRVDSGEPVQVMVERCEPAGCRAGIRLRETLRSQLAAGRTLTVTFHDAERKPIEVPLKLDGFAAGLNALKGRKPES